MRVPAAFCALLFVAFASLASAQAPVVFDGGTVNAGSFLPAGLPSHGVARGSMFTVFGQNLGPVEFIEAPSVPLGTELGGSSISVTVNGVTRSAFMLFTQAGQLSAVLPSDLPAGVGALVVTYNGLSSAPVSIVVVDSSFGIYARNQAGFGPGIVQNFVSPAEQPVNAVILAAHPGQIVIIWGTGLGPIDGNDADFPPVGDLPVDVKVWIGGKLAVLQYAGRTSQFPGIDQINVVIPDGVLGCYVPVVVVVNGVPSNYVTIAVTQEGDFCSDFQTFRPGELQTVTQNGMGGFAFAEINRFRGVLQIGDESADVTVDEGRAIFNSYTTDQIVAMTPRRLLVLASSTSPALTASPTRPRGPGSALGINSLSRARSGLWLGTLTAATASTKRSWGAASETRPCRCISIPACTRSPAAPPHTTSASSTPTSCC